MTCRLDLTRRALTVAALLMACSCAQAAVLALTPTASGDALHVVDVQTLNATTQEAASCCAVQTGTVTADPDDHVLFFVANDSSGPLLYSFSYGSSTTIASVPISSGTRISQMNFDQLREQLVALVSDDNGGTDIANVDPGTGTVTTIAALGPDCCVLRQGVAAYLPLTRTLYAVGRRSTDSTDQLLAFDMADGVLAQNADLGTLRVSQLATDGISLYALVYTPSTDDLTLDQVSTANLGFTQIGNVASGCCFALTGPATIDVASNSFNALLRSSDGSNLSTVTSFSLNDGTMTQGNAIQAMGLFDDTAALSDRIFADGFEVDTP